MLTQCLSFFAPGIDTTIRTTTDSQSVLHWACAGGSLDVIHTLWKAGIKDYADPDDRGYQAIHVAVQNGHSGLVHYLCVREVEIDTQDKEKVTPLHWAAIKGHMEIARYLVSRGADPSRQDIRGYNALHWAVSTANYAVAQYMANDKTFHHLLKMKDAKGNTPRALAPKDKRIFSAMLQRAEVGRKLSDTNMKALWLTLPGSVLLLFYILQRYEFSFLMTAIITGGAGAFVGYFVRNALRPVPATDTLMIGLFYSHALTTLFYCLYIGYALLVEKYGTVYMYAFSAWGATMIAIHVWLVHSDPGTLRVKPQNDGQEYIAEIERDIEPAPVCSSCLVRKPIRCKHDAVTNRCYIRFDHYCIWIFNVVGNDNHFPFMIMLGMCVLAHFWALFNFVTVFIANLPKEWVWGDVSTALGNDFMLAYLMVFQFVNGGWEALLWIQQAQMVLQNATMNELMNWQHYSHFWKNGSASEFYNPFDHGVSKNFHTFVNQRRVKDLYHLYHIAPHQEV